MIIDEETSIIGKFISNGIEIEKDPTVRTASISRFDRFINDDIYKNALNLIKHLNLKIKIPKSVIYGETMGILTAIIEKFISDGIEIDNDYNNSLI